MQWVHIIDFKKPGPTTLIVWWVHGNEIVWEKAIEYLITKTETMIVGWKIITLQANLEGKKMNKRYVDHDLNRAFASEDIGWSYEVSRAHEIKDFFKEIPIDYAFDLHSTPSKSDPMILCTSQPSSLTLASKMPIYHVVQWLIDRVEWMSLLKYFQPRLKLGMAFECGCHEDDVTITIGKKIIDTIIDFHQGKELPSQNDQMKIAITDIVYTADPNFVYTKPYKWFEMIEKWEVWWVDSMWEHRFEVSKIIVIPNTMIAQDLEKQSKTWVAYFWDTIKNK